MIVTLDGTPGSGKNFIGEELAKKLKIKFFSMGDLMRHMAKRKGMTLEEFNKLRDKSPDIDKDIDNYMVELSREEAGFVITSRTSHHFLPQATNIFLGCTPEEAANRIWPDLQESAQRNEGQYRTKEELVQGLKKRQDEDRKRYKKYYNIDIYDVTKYDFALDTSKLGKKEVFRLVNEFVKSCSNA